MTPSDIEDAAFVKVVARFYPQSRLLRTWSLAGGVSAQTTALEIELPDGRTERLVLRRHGIRDIARNPGIAAAEFRLLQFLQSWGVAAPAPLHLDESGAILESSYLILEHVEGEPLSGAAISDDGLRQLASLLATIHRIDGSEPRLSFLPQQDASYAELMNPTHVAEAIAERIRDALRPRWPISPQNPPSLLHGDVWPGNVIWRNGRIAALVDWEDAALGDPLSDVANARMELSCFAGADAMATFTNHYRSIMPIDFSRLSSWDLCAALRWISGVGHWRLDEAREKTMRDRHQQFVARALAELSSQS